MRPSGESELGYRIHTNRELGMMLRGEKPLAVFSGNVEGRFPDALDRYLRMFDRHVAAGSLIRQDHFETLSGLPGRMQVVLYALPRERWRIPAMIDLRRKLGPWSDEDERAEGALLGYKPWQVEAWMARRAGKT